MKEGIAKYVKIIKRLYVVFTIVMLVAIMVSAVFMFNKFFAFYFITPALLITWLVVYGCYALRVSMGTVLQIEVTKEVIHLKTKRKTYTFDREHGCEKVEVKGNKFIGTFVTEKSRDKFIFYRRVLFSAYQNEQFTKEDIALFYPQIEQMNIH